MNTLQNLFLTLEEHFQNKNYKVKVINKKTFKKDEFVFDEEQIPEYICNLLIYEWLYDHKDTRYKDFTFVLRPDKVHIKLDEVPLEELMHFISPQTKKTKSKGK